MLHQQDTMECPRCGKRGLVRRTQNIYQCLSCNFRRDFSQPFLGEETLLALIGLIILALILLFTVQANSMQDFSEKVDPALNQEVSSD